MGGFLPGTTRLWRWPSLPDIQYRQVWGGVRGKADVGVELVPASPISTNDAGSSCSPARVKPVTSWKPSAHRHSDRKWVMGVLICAYAAAAVLLINIILTLVATAVSFARHGTLTMTAATIYEGSCSRTKAWTTGLHLLINVLSTVVLGASSYCMQCLTAPARSDVDRAHGERVWLHIGVASLRNLAWAERSRLALWTALAITSLPIHLMYVRPDRRKEPGLILTADTTPPCSLPWAPRSTTSCWRRPTLTLIVHHQRITMPRTPSALSRTRP